MEKKTVTVACRGCGSFGTGPTPEAAWSNVPHEGHGHEAEELEWAEAEAGGAAEEI